jgi:cold shock CspA family protein
MQGTVKWYSDMRSHGFIRAENGQDIYVHEYALPHGESLFEGDKVKFDVKNTRDGKHAVNLTVM